MDKLLLKIPTEFETDYLHLKAHRVRLECNDTSMCCYQSPSDAALYYGLLRSEFESGPGEVGPQRSFIIAKEL